MQERDRKTNQQKKQHTSAGVGIFDQHGKTAWRATGPAARTAGSTPSAHVRALAPAPLDAPPSPALAGPRAAVPRTGTNRRGPGSTVINVTPGMTA
jgi:hypothetical protein